MYHETYKTVNAYLNYRHPHSECILKLPSSATQTTTKRYKVRNSNNTRDTFTAGWACRIQRSKASPSGRYNSSNLTGHRIELELFDRHGYIIPRVFKSAVVHRQRRASRRVQDSLQYPIPYSE
ncbi:hypothetical protein NPIL_292011 [Nephila pilipes]|uniref:Uncharacterized protein n=1 Tax=Nephila pilipes TaxID=299642 RepID=A0A8X6TRM8_NEPPI|nr:hypothetical protein NPIL_292011 [Nephila pilipes]